MGLYACVGGCESGGCRGGNGRAGAVGYTGVGCEWEPAFRATRDECIHEAEVGMIGSGERACGE